MGIDNRWFCFLHTSLSISSLITDCASTFIYSFTDGFALRNSSMLTWCCESFHFLYSWFRWSAFWRIRDFDCSEWCLLNMGLAEPCLSCLCFGWLTFVLSIYFCVISLYLLNRYDLVWIKVITTDKYWSSWKKLGHAIDFFDFNIIFYMIALFYRLGWKVSSSGFVSFQPSF